MAAKAIVGELENAVMLNLSAVHVEEGFNKRTETMRLPEIIGQIVAAGHVYTPIEVYKATSGYNLIAGHRRHTALTVIKLIQAGTLTQEEALSEYKISKVLYDNVNAATGEVSFVLPAIVQPEGSVYSRRLLSLWSNAGVPLSGIEQGYEWLHLLEATVAELEEASKGRFKVKEGRSPDEKVTQADIAVATGFTPSHISQSLLLVKKELDDTPEKEAARELVRKAITSKLIDTNDGRPIIRKAETEKEAQAMIDAVVAAKAEAAAKAAELAKKKKPGTIPLAPSNAPPVAPPAAGTVPPPGTGKAATGEPTSNERKRDDQQLLMGILSRQGLTFVRDTAEQYANHHRPKLPIPWSGLDQQQDKAA